MTSHSSLRRKKSLLFRSQIRSRTATSLGELATCKYRHRHVGAVSQWLMQSRRPEARRGPRGAGPGRPRAAALERRIAGVLSLPPPSVTVTIDDGNGATIVVYPEGDDGSLAADAVAAIINDAIQHGKVSEWTTDGAVCSVAEDEESASITEEEALEMWRDMTEEARTGHLDKVPSPDGVMIQPSNEMRATNADRADGVVHCLLQNRTTHNVAPPRPSWTAAPTTTSFPRARSPP